MTDNDPLSGWVDGRIHQAIEALNFEGLKMLIKNKQMSESTPILPAQEQLTEPTGCLCCGKESDGFTVCVDCGVEMFMEGNNGNPVKHCKEHNPERFEMIMNWYNQQNKNECLK